MAHRASVSMVVIDYPWTKTKEDVAAFYNVEETKGLSEERVKRDLESAHVRPVKQRIGPPRFIQQNEARLEATRTACARNDLTKHVGGHPASTPHFKGDDERIATEGEVRVGSELELKSRRSAGHTDRAQTVRSNGVTRARA